MTRKDFELIAMAMRHAMPEEGASEEVKGAWALAVHELAYALKGTNPAFDKTRFMSACMRAQLTNVR